MKTFRLLLVFLLIPSLCYASASRSFSGNDGDEVSIADVAALRPGTSAFSQVIWFNGGSQANAIFTKRLNSSPFNQWSIWAGSITGTCDAFNSNQQIAVTIIESYTTDMWCTNTNSNYLDSTWRMIVVTRPATDTDPLVYIDGSVVAVTDNTDNATQPQNVTTTVAWEIGNNNGQNNSFAGDLSNALLYSRELTAIEVSEIRFKPEMVPDARELYMPVWGDATEVDLSGNGRTGAVTGTTTSASGPPIGFGGLLPL